MHLGPQKAFHARSFALVSQLISCTLNARQEGASGMLTEAYTVACDEFGASINFNCARRHETAATAYWKISIIGSILSFLTQTKACFHHSEHK